MYGENRIDDILRFVKALLSNWIATFFPRYYVQLTGQTGRGPEEENAEEIAAYFLECFNEYFAKLGVAESEIDRFLQGKRVLEYGPGDVPGVGLLMYAHGAAQVYCVDRFPLVSITPKNAAVLECLMNGLDEPRRSRAASCFNETSNAQSGFATGTIDYLVQPSGLSGLNNTVDLIVSRAVLEHVNDLQATFADMSRALHVGGIAAHQVDLKSHGLHRNNKLDFLTWPSLLWDFMYSHKGVPNRWRVNRYLEVIREMPFNINLLNPIELLDDDEIQQVRPHLAPPFRDVSNDDLSWLSFWLVIAKQDDSELITS